MPNDGSLYFAVDMHDATTDMRARDGSRLRADHRQQADGARPRSSCCSIAAPIRTRPFVGQLHSTTLCCGDEINASPFYRAAVAADVEALKLMIAQGRQGRVEPDRGEEGRRARRRGGGGRGNANVGKTPVMVAMVGGRGAAFAAGPGFERLGPPPFREASNREPLEALKVLLAAGANPNAKAPDGVDAAASGGARRGRWRSSARWSRPARSSTR